MTLIVMDVKFNEKKKNPKFVWLIRDNSFLLGRFLDDSNWQFRHNDRKYLFVTSYENLWENNKNYGSLLKIK